MNNIMLPEHYPTAQLDRPAGKQSEKTQKMMMTDKYLITGEFISLSAYDICRQTYDIINL